MDKVERALTATEDNAVAIRALNNKLAKLTKALEFQKTELIRGSTNLYMVAKRGVNTVSFTDIESDGSVCAFLVFDGAEQCTIKFCGKTVAKSPSPACVVLPKGKGDLVILTATAGYALVLAPSTTERKA